MPYNVPAWPNPRQSSRGEANEAPSAESSWIPQLPFFLLTEGTIFCAETMSVPTGLLSFAPGAHGKDAFSQPPCIWVGTCYSSSSTSRSDPKRSCLILYPLSPVHLHGSKDTTLNMMERAQVPESPGSRHLGELCHLQWPLWVRNEFVLS